MKHLKESFFWILVFGEHLIAFTVMAMCISLPLRATGFWSGYIGWAIVLALLIPELDDDVRDALKRWALRRGGKA